MRRRFDGPDGGVAGGDPGRRARRAEMGRQDANQTGKKSSKFKIFTLGGIHVFSSFFVVPEVWRVQQGRPQLLQAA